MKSPVMSVLMPAYNAEKYLRESIESILNQTYQDFELLVFNDGSKDHTEDIILSYTDTRIRYFKNETNLGLVKTLNKGILLSSGEFIARMDADDISLPERLEKQLEFMQKNPKVGVCGTWYNVINDPNYIFRHPVEHDKICLAMLLHNPIGHPTVMIRKSEMVGNNIFYEEDFPSAEDYKLWATLSKHTRLATIPEVLLKYRLHDDQVRKTHSTVQVDSTKKVQQFLYSFIYQNGQASNADLSALASPEHFYEKEVIHQTGLSFKKLSEANQIKKIYGPSILKNFLGNLWIKLCITNISKHNFWIIKTYWQTSNEGLSKTFITNLIKLCSISAKHTLKTMIKKVIGLLLNTFYFRIYHRLRYNNSIRVMYFKWLYKSRLNIKENFQMGKDADIHLYHAATLSIGSNTKMDKFSSLDCSNVIKIGNNCFIGQGTKLTDFLNSIIEIGHDCGFGDYTSLKLTTAQSKVVIQSHTSFRKFCNIMVEGGNLTIGEKVFFNNYCSVNCLGEISIGDNSAFGEGVKLYDHNHKYNDPFSPIREQGMSIGKITIGKNCWIGSNTVILNNVTIGDHVVIGAHNLIYKSIPSNTVIKAKVDKLDVRN